MNRIVLSLVAIAGIVSFNSTADAQLTAAEQARRAELGAPTADPEDRFAIAGAPWRGSVEPTVLIVEFSDFQCPFCSRVNPTLDQILETYPDDVTLVFKHMPLAFHDRADEASLASIAAHENGVFWEYHDAVFGHQNSLTDEDLQSFGELVGVGASAIATALASRSGQPVIDADVALAGEYGVRGTPNFLINGRTLSGAQPYASFASAIDEEIAAMDALMESGVSRQDALAVRMEVNQTAAAVQADAAAAAAPPEPPSEMPIDVTDRTVLGPDYAPVTIAVFYDFECPFCARSWNTMNDLRTNYGDDVRLVIMHNPLSFHTNARTAAEGIVAAAEQGEADAFISLVFDNYTAISQIALEGFAEELGLDMDAYRATRDSTDTDQRIDDDIAYAAEVQATGTPQFFINGRRIRGAQPYESFEVVVDEELEAAQELLDEGVELEDVYEARLEELGVGLE